MALTQCPECGKEISDAAKACPNCGHPMQSAEIGDDKRKKDGYKKLGIIGGIIAVTVVVLLLLMPTIRMETLSPEQKYLYQVVKELRSNLLNENSLQIKEAYVTVNPSETSTVAIVVMCYSAQNQGGGYTGRNAGFYVHEDGSILQRNDRSSESSNEVVLETLIFEKALYNVLKEGKELTVEEIEQVMKMF